ncbi:MAG: phage tail protein [Pseudomonadota bacterium]
MATPSRYLRLLPEILRGGDGDDGFLAGYLKVFEALLSGRDEPAVADLPALEHTIDKLPALMDPALTPVAEEVVAPPPAPPELTSPFLDFLGRWVALAFDQNWGLDKRREWLRRIVPLYKQRGTFAGLSAYLAMFVGNQARVEELIGGFVVGIKPSSIVGVSTFIAGAPAHYFRVRLVYGFFPTPFNFATWKNLRRSTKAIVDLEKPAHTYYTLRASAPGIIVGGPKHGGPNDANPAVKGKGRATIGRDTLIWQDSKQF